MRKVPETITTEERKHPKQRPFSLPFAMLLQNIFKSRIEEGEKLFRGSNYGFYNPIYISRRGKFKGYMRENRRYNTFKGK